DHRHRDDRRRDRLHPRGGGGHRRPRRGERGLLDRRRGRSHRDRAGPRVRADRRGHRRADQQGAGRAGDRDAHRVPRLLPARPRRRLLDRVRLRRL
ncbi:MAG: Transcriptional regulator, AsnC family, partial [uncultured Blastococcus sp.]